MIRWEIPICASLLEPEPRMKCVELCTKMIRSASLGPSVILDIESFATDITTAKYMKKEERRIKSPPAKWCADIADAIKIIARINEL